MDDLIGSIKSIYVNQLERTADITFTVPFDEVIITDGRKLKDKTIRLSYKQYRPKRSNDANSYFHVLKGKLADKLNVSKPFMHNTLLRKYGQLEYIDEKVVEMILRDEIEVDEWSFIHLLPTAKTKTMDNGALYRVYLVIRGSHTYDTKEMSQLLDGTISDCKELGIETLTPMELQMMKEAYHAKTN